MKFSDTWAGTSKADFITASYDIKSGIASLTDEGVAQFTQLAALTGKATKSTTEEMGSLFATGYGIYKGFYDDMSDLEFGEMFSAGIATAVKNYKTSGSEMASAISALGATATNANVPLEEQLAIMGQLQTTMSGSEAATKYKSFLNQASSAGEKLGLTFLDTNNQLLSMPDILTELKGKYGETIDAVEKRELKEAFGTDEAVALIDLLYNNVETLDSGIQDLQGSMKNGISVTEEMAEAINNTPEQKFQVLKQQIHNNVEELGNGLLPAVNNTMDKVSGLIQKGSKWISNNQETVQSIMNIALKLGVFLVIAGSVMGVIGSLGKLFLSAKNAIGLVKTATLGMNTAFLASPITWVIQGTFSTAYSVINNLTGGKLESIRSTISNKIQAAKDTVSSVLDSIKSAFSSKLEAARSVVSSTIEKIKGVFNFSWKLPDLKLPHISVNGGQAPYGIGGKGSLPSFSIQWYKEGGILNGATIFGAMGGNLLGGGEAGAEAVLPLSELWKQMTEIVKGVVKGENEESGDTVQQTGANITSALTSKAASVRKEKESKTTTTKETYTSERWGKEGGTTIHQISFTVDISKIKDLPLLYKLIDELKDAQNRTDSPTPATT